jgi:hypothetical protein
MRKYQQLVKQIRGFAEREGVGLLKHWDAATTRRFRETWTAL